jgi:hypothetical protein
MESEEFETQLAQVHVAKESSENNLLPLTNVQGVGIGYKQVGGKETTDLCIVVYVDKKKPASKLAKTDIVPKVVDIDFAGGKSQVPTDIQVVDEIKALAFTDRIRPVKPGFSIGHYKITAGTFGCLVKDTCSPCRIYILSNNHVLANSNNARKGDPITQPGRVDGGTTPKDVIARLSRFVPIRYGGKNKYNLVDAAIALPTSIRHVIPPIIAAGIPKGTVEAILGMKVIKSGRTTETTTGKVTGIDVTVSVNYGSAGVAYFRNQILTTNMSKGGDSGSLLLSQADKKATGLLFAGSSKVTIHNNIANVINALGVEIVTTY